MARGYRCDSCGTAKVVREFWKHTSGRHPGTVCNACFEQHRAHARREAERQARERRTRREAEKRAERERSLRIYLKGIERREEEQRLLRAERLRRKELRKIEAAEAASIRPRSDTWTSREAGHPLKETRPATLPPKGAEGRTLGEST